MEELDDEAPPLKRRKYCNHCSGYVGYSMYYRHHERFFDPVTSQWTVEYSAKVGAFSDLDTETSHNEFKVDCEIEVNFQGSDGSNEGRYVSLYRRMLSLA